MLEWKPRLALVLVVIVAAMLALGAAEYFGGAQHGWQHGWSDTGQHGW